MVADSCTAGIILASGMLGELGCGAHGAVISLGGADMEGRDPNSILVKLSEATVMKVA